MPDFYAIAEDKGGPGRQWFNHAVTPRPLTDHEINRARLYCADQAVDADELREFLGMLGLMTDD